MGAILTVLIVCAAFYLVFYVFFPLGRGAIYDPSTQEETLIMAELAAVAVGEKAADLGSGDGRVVIALARRGAETHGFEVNPVLVMVSRRNIRRAGLEGKAFIHWRSFWRADLSGFDVITVFQVSFVMGRLETKVQRELAPGARIVSHYWRFPTLTVEAARGDIYRYRVG
jgi:cyclopropane fatty-acyl-phospholipid synthase-like methyltransferase